uniref:Reverse transcriptase domain-containing protein n=1 Tax=Gongylonema pulchrum TaxID=637853 RepID=A0A183D3B3_9BILA
LDVANKKLSEYNFSDVEYEKLIPRKSTAAPPPSYDFDDDIVEYKEEKDSPTEEISTKSVLSKNHTDKTDSTSDFRDHGPLCADVISTFSEPPLIPLSPISEANEERVDEIQKTPLPPVQQEMSDNEDVVRQCDGESLRHDTNDEVLVGIPQKVCFVSFALVNRDIGISRSTAKEK